jgi:hypothetical protein
MTMKIKLTTLLSSVFISLFSFGQIGVEDLKVDTTITGFHFAADFQGTFVYTLNGKADLNTINPSAFAITIMSDATYQAALDQINNLLNMSIQNGYAHSDIIKKDTIINGNNAYYTSLTETQNGTDYKNLIFYAFYIKDKKALFFLSGDLNNGKYIEKFKKTFCSTKW